MEDIFDERSFFYPLDKENIKNKQYSLGALTVAHMNGYLKKDDNDKVEYRVIDRQEFAAEIKARMKITKYKCNVIIDTFLELGIMEKYDDDKLIMSGVNSNFLKLFVPTAKYCLNNLSDFNFKLYCFLKNKQNIHDAYHLSQMYYFTDKELLETLGYNSTKPENRKKINEALSTLEHLGLISYEHDYHGRPGKNGLYRGLKAVYDVAAPEYEARKQTKQYFQLNGVEISDDHLLDL